MLFYGAGCPRRWAGGGCRFAKEPGPPQEKASLEGGHLKAQPYREREGEGGGVGGGRKEGSRHPAGVVLDVSNIFKILEIRAKPTIHENSRNQNINIECEILPSIRGQLSFLARSRQTSPRDGERVRLRRRVDAAGVTFRRP